MTDLQATAPGGDVGSAVSNGRSSAPDLPTTVPTGGVRSTSIPGHISIAPRVLTRVGGAIVAETLDVDRADVRVEAHDDSGRLALRVETPIAVPPLTGDLVVTNGGVLGTVRSVQRTVVEQVLAITGRTVSRVDVTVTGARLERPERLR